MPPLQVPSFSHDSPTQAPRRRGSAQVPFEVLHSAKLGLLFPEPEEPRGTCRYAHNSVITTTTGDDDETADAAAASARVSVQEHNRRPHGRQQRRRRSSSESKQPESSVFAWLDCTDNNSCTIS